MYFTQYYSLQHFQEEKASSHSHSLHFTEKNDPVDTVKVKVQIRLDLRRVLVARFFFTKLQQFEPTIFKRHLSFSRSKDSSFFFQHCTIIFKEQRFFFFYHCSYFCSYGVITKCCNDSVAGATNSRMYRGMTLPGEQSNYYEISLHTFRERLEHVEQLFRPKTSARVTPYVYLYPPAIS